LTVNCFETFDLKCHSWSEKNVTNTWIFWSILLLLLLLLLQSALQPLVGFRPAQLSLSILRRKVLLSAVASDTSNPQLGEEPGI
jgi:hypothetical protein